MLLPLVFLMNLVLGLAIWGAPLDLNKKEDLFMNYHGIWFSNV